MQDRSVRATVSDHFMARVTADAVCAFAPEDDLFVNVHNAQTGLHAFENVSVGF
jgi:hypothetical protein